MLPSIHPNRLTLPQIPKLKCLNFPSPGLDYLECDYHSSKSPILRKYYKYSTSQLRRVRHQRLKSLKAGYRELEEWKEELDHKKAVTQLVQKHCRVSISLLETHQMTAEQLVDTANLRRKAKVTKQVSQHLKTQTAKQRVKRMMEQVNRRAHMAACLLQRHWRLHRVTRRQSRQRFAEQEKQREEAALRIQRMYRGHR